MMFISVLVNTITFSLGIRVLMFSALGFVFLRWFGNKYSTQFAWVPVH